MIHHRPTRRAVAALGTILLLAACGEEPVAETETIRPVRAIQVADTANVDQRSFTGRARATQEVDLAFRVAGPLVSRPVDVGTEVARGAVVAQIDQDTFKANVARAQAELQAAEAGLANAAEQLRRKQFLVERGHESRAALDRFLAAEKSAEADVAAKQAVLKRNQLDLSYTTLRAPFAGIVVRTFVENFQEVRPRQAVVRLVDSSKIEMVVNIPENLISQAHLVKRAIVVFDPFPDLEIEAQIKEIGTEASETTRTFPVTLIMDQPDGATILPGMAGRARRGDFPQPAESGGRIVVPETAILTAPGDTAKTFVWIVDAGSMTVARREIGTSQVTAEGYVVSDGLTPGEWIVTAGVNFLKEGQKVRLLNQ